MEVGFGSITCQRYPGDPRGDGDRYREALALLEALQPKAMERALRGRRRVHLGRAGAK